MRVIAIDPGYDRIGVAVIEKGDDGKEKILHSSCIFTNKKQDIPERIFFATEEIHSLIQKFQANAFAIEKLFFAKNTKTALAVAEARGAFIFQAKKNNLPIFEFTPNQIKSAITGNGNATKKDLLFFINKIIHLDEKKQYIDDEIDAIAIGVTYFAYVKNNHYYE